MTTLIVGAIDGVEAFPKFTVLNISVEVKSRNGVEFKIYPVKYFGERARKFSEMTDLRGRSFESTCYVESWQSNSGSWYLSLNGGDYKLGEPPAPVEPVAPPPPGPEGDIDDDLPFSCRPLEIEGLNS
jgi:hypothetical protein